MYIDQSGSVDLQKQSKIDNGEAMTSPQIVNSMA